MPKIQAETKPVQRKDIVWKIVDEEGILLHLESSDYFAINDTGLEIWKYMDGKKTLEEIGSKLADEYGIREEAAMKNLKDFIERLLEHKLIHLS